MFEIIPPLSDPKRGRLHREALPILTKEMCGEKGIQLAVGFAPNPDVGFEGAYIVYRGTWDNQKQEGQWNFLYSGPVQMYVMSPKGIKS